MGKDNIKLCFYMRGGGVPLDFDFREWLMIGCKNAVGKQADYQIVENATAYIKERRCCHELFFSRCC